MSEHTPTPWMAASKYSSVVGVPIVNQQGKRIGNTALPGMPPEWDALKRQAEIDAAFIVKAVNSHDAQVKALRAFVDHATYPVSTELNPRGYEWRGQSALDYAKGLADEALALVGGSKEP